MDAFVLKFKFDRAKKQHIINNYLDIRNRSNLAPSHNYKIMTTILNFLLSYLLIYKYYGIFIDAFLAAIALPLPASAILTASRTLLAQGYLNIYYLLASAFMGNIAGDILGYYIARKYGTIFLNKVSFATLTQSKMYISLDGYMNQFSISLMFFTRFITGGSSIVNILFGVYRISFYKFLITAILEESSYVLVYRLLGYYLGNEWENNLSFVFEVVGVYTFIRSHSYAFAIRTYTKDAKTCKINPR